MAEYATKAPIIWLLAGEASGDVLGARLMLALRQMRPGLAFAGIGGPRMEAAGLSPCSRCASCRLGLAEILPRLRTLNRRLAQAAADIGRLRPTWSSPSTAPASPCVC